MEIPLASVIITEDLGLEGTQRAGFAKKKMRKVMNFKKCEFSRRIT